MRCCFSAAVGVAICLHLLSHSTTCTQERARTSTVLERTQLCVHQEERGLSNPLLRWLDHKPSGQKQSRSSRLPSEEEEEFPRRFLRMSGFMCDVHEVQNGHFITCRLKSLQKRRRTQEIADSLSWNNITFHEVKRLGWHLFHINDPFSVRQRQCLFSSHNALVYVGIGIRDVVFIFLSSLPFSHLVLLLF